MAGNTHTFGRDHLLIHPQRTYAARWSASVSRYDLKLAGTPQRRGESLFLAETATSLYWP